MGTKLIFFALILLFIYESKAALQCHDIENADSQQVWQIMKLSTFDRIFLLTAGMLSLIILILTALSWIVYPSFSTPSDIIFAIVLSELVQNLSMVIEAGYFTSTDNSPTQPQNFDKACYLMGIFTIFGNVSSIYYNLIFCVIMAYSIRKTLKGFLFNRFRYHVISFVVTGSIILTLVLTGGLGRGLNGICGFRVASKQSTSRFVLQILVSAVCIYSMINFKVKFPKNEYFQKQSVFGFYFYYMGAFVFTQVISSISFLVSDIVCKVNSVDITQVLHVLYSISIVVSIALSYAIAFVRFQQPILRKKIKSCFVKEEQSKQESKRNNQHQMQDEDFQEQQGDSWLGCLLQSLKGSQILSFLEGITVAFIEKQRKFKQQELTPLSYKKHYTFLVNQEIVQNYIQRRISSRQSLMVQKKLGGLIGLDYEVVSYCPDVFSSLCTKGQLQKIIKSLDIRKNIKMVKKQSHMNGGKSGELFFETADNRLIFKTLRQDEVHSYLSKAKDFIEHFKKEKLTLIVKILGIFKFLRKDIKQDPIYLMLMYNITMLPRDVNIRVYDIKGSQFNRSTIQQNHIDNRKEDKLRRFTLKDKDFKKLENKIRINQILAKDLKRVARKDIQFLGSMGYMDYSLLIIKRSGQKSFEDKGLTEIPSSAEDNVIYNFGIIDYLQSWTLKRKAQRVLKTLITKEQVTANSPISYSHRLCEFIDSIF